MSAGQVSGVMADYIAVTNLEHVACGIYLWEWATSLSYELDFFTGKRPWRLTLWPYLICRYCVLGTVVNLLFVLDAQTSLNCVVWVKFEILLPYMGVLMASFLIVVRVTAIWNRHPAVLALSAASIAAQLALLIYSVTVAAAVRGPDGQGCVLLNSVEASLPALAATFAIDALLLVLMLVGLLTRKDTCGFGFWTFLWKQNLVWLALATAAELPTVTLLSLDLNDAIHQLFQTPEVIIL
ncbi:hypothetical protein PENSPDRAFT_682182 [Peniophora sp. CONT]|nr:hypothetical protein PENSPDRAFT_682182 [Peniophora sp. CONT]